MAPGAAPGGDFVKVDVLAQHSGEIRKGFWRPAVVQPNIVWTKGEDGLSWNAGSSPLLIRRRPRTIASLNAFSAQSCAVRSFQKSTKRRQRGRSFFQKPNQSRAAHTAPPDVPLILTTLKSRPTCWSTNPFNTPAVNAVWLPPP